MTNSATESKARGVCGRRILAGKKPAGLRLPSCTRTARRLLAPSKAPVCFQSTLRAQYSPTRKLVAACAWVEKPTPLPHLLDNRPFDHCLKDVLETPAYPRQNEEAGPTTSPSLSRTTASRKRENSAKSPYATPPPSRPQPRVGTPGRTESPPILAPKEYPTRARLDVLARHAGGYKALSQLNKRPVKHHLRNISHRISPEIVPLLTSAHPIPGWSNPAEWVQRVGKRVAQMALRMGRTVSQATRGIRQRQVEGPASTGTTNVETRSLAVLGGWADRATLLTLDGPVAPLDLLLRLIEDNPRAGFGSPRNSEGLAARNRRGNASRLQAEEVPGRVFSQETLHSQAERTASGVQAWDAPFSRAPLQGASYPEIPPPTGSQQGFYPQAGSLPLPAAGQPNFRPPLASPLATENAPTLLAPQAVFDAPTPFASAASRQAAKQEEAALAEEDLDILAAKIKRILDEEARRHGITV